MTQPILIVAPRGKNKETVKRLARVGYDNSIGYLKGGFDAWKKEKREIDQIETIGLNTFSKTFNKRANILDLRKPGEFSGAHIETAQNFPLDFINQNMSEVSKNKKYYLHCRSSLSFYPHQVSNFTNLRLSKYYLTNICKYETSFIYLGVSTNNILFYEVWICNRQSQMHWLPCMYDSL